LHDTGVVVRGALIIFAAAVALIGCLAGVTKAQPAASEPEASSAEGETIVVVGSRDRRDPVSAFVDDATMETGGQIAKFAAPICPISLGLPPGHGEVIEARVRQIAQYLGLGVAAGDCQPNVVVIVAEEGGDFVRQLRRERPRAFAALQLAELRGVMRLAGPVRAWQVVEPRGADGRPMRRISFIEGGGGPPRYVANGYELAGVVPSLTSRPTRQDLSLSFVVFDLPAIDGLSLLQIADYAAMRTLARTAGAGLPARRSILTLFDNRNAGAEPVRELTNWDAAYLRALYGTNNVVTAQQQRSNMSRVMRRELAPAANGRGF
jgi:hypothetical protein